MPPWPHLRRIPSVAATTFGIYSFYGLAFGKSPLLVSLIGRPAFFGLVLFSSAVFLAAVSRRLLRAPSASGWIWAHRAARAFVGVLAGILATGAFWNAVGAVAMSQAKTAVRSAGFSLVFPAIGPKVPAEENAAVLYKRIEALASVVAMKDRGKVSVFLSDFIGKAAQDAASSEDFARARELIKAHQDVLDLAAQAAARPRDDWEIQWGYDPVWRMPTPRYFGPVLAARLLAARAILASRDGRQNEAVESLRLAWAEARSAGRSGNFIGAIVQSFIWNQCADAAQFVLRRAPLMQAWRQWEPFLAPQEVEDRFWQALALENFTNPLWFERLGWWDISFGKYRHEREEVLKYLPFYWPFLKLDLASSLRAHLDEDQAMRLPRPLALAQSREARNHAQKSAWLIAAFASPNYFSSHDKVLAALARMRLLRTAFAARRFREKAGRWPAAARELSDFEDAKNLEDPFTNAPFRFTADKAGLRIESAGYRSPADAYDDSAAPAALLR